MIIKEIFLTLQGEGCNLGKSFVFCRVGNCNLEKLCYFCDTDFKTDLKSLTPAQVADEIKKIAGPSRNVVFTGGEPLLQQDDIFAVLKILNASENWYCAVETNGTQKIDPLLELSIDWVCVSPKTEKLQIKQAHEVKVVLTKENKPNLNLWLQTIQSKNYFISPEAPPYRMSGYTPVEYLEKSNINECIEYVKRNPQWRLNLQTHKIINIP